MTKMDLVILLMVVFILPIFMVCSATSPYMSIYEAFGIGLMYSILLFSVIVIYWNAFIRNMPNLKSNEVCRWMK